LYRPFGPTAGGAPPLTEAIPTTPAPGVLRVAMPLAPILRPSRGSNPSPTERLCAPTGSYSPGPGAAALVEGWNSVEPGATGAIRATRVLNVFAATGADAYDGRATYAPGPGVIDEVALFTLIFRASDEEKPAYDGAARRACTSPPYEPGPTAAGVAFGSTMLRVVSRKDRQGIDMVLSRRAATHRPAPGGARARARRREPAAQLATQRSRVRPRRAYLV
jgi:hypothetical protein